MSHRYIELFLNSSSSGSSGMSLSGIGNFCGGTCTCLLICQIMLKFYFYNLKSFVIVCFNIYMCVCCTGLGNNFRPGYSPNNRGFNSQLGGNNYNSF